ncbi:SDR family oxidoreductase [Plantactinospora mayteni]|uniref:Short chain dehydrogenase n=1 Tax=Plantactinospora mayteni TaxID=566021 RepID=A0ABQ4EIN2_9ACTN|nr:glucose 1-dehydrogenase [Plantactinospora mayteni]GIG94096.1 short chain dehydrogenase [Plantactinospora mayteni]
MAGRFEGRVAVVTGGAAGFGRAVGQRLLADGARVVLVDRDAEALAGTAAELGGTGPVRAIRADVSQEAEVAGYVAEAVAAYGRIDAFFNNAGIEGRMAPITELGVDDFDRVIAVNLRGVFLGLREVLRVMKAQRGGAIVNTASMAGIRGSATFSPYVASKHGVIGLTRCAALEGAPYGIRVNTVAPGHIDTRMARDLTVQVAPDDPQGAYDRAAARVPLARYGTAEEVAHLATWLLSDEASYVSGATHLIDGALNA